MKKISVLIIASLMASAVLADTTSFAWGGGSASDGVTTVDYVLTILDDDGVADIWSYISGGQIDINDLNLFTVFSSNLAAIVPFGPSIGQWGTASMPSTDDSIVGNYVYAIVSDSSTIGGIFVNDTFLLSEIDGTIEAGTTPASVPTIFSPGTTTTITVVPEPATALLFGIGGIGAFIIRRNKKKAQEEA